MISTSYSRPIISSRDPDHVFANARAVAEYLRATGKPTAQHYNIAQCAEMNEHTVLREDWSKRYGQHWLFAD